MRNVHADVTILAGDTNIKGVNGPDLAARMFPERPVVLVSGNHDLYRDFRNILFRTSAPNSPGAGETVGYNWFLLRKF